MSANTVHVKNISSNTSEKEVKDFFSFCGKITTLEITPGDATKTATVTFEKETAAKTALLLDNTQLGSTQVQVTSASGSTDDDGSHFTSNTERDSDDITQEEKPRSRIVAEYLAHGYVLGDVAIQRAIDLDSKHGVSDRFLSTVTNLNNKYHATDKAKSVDQSYGVTPRVNSLLSGLTSYYEKATGTPTGQKLVNFYTQTSRQVMDVHTEARRLADLKKEEGGPTPTKVPGTEKTTCKCNLSAKDCPCDAGKCACAGCEKSDVKKVEGTDKTNCKCGGKTEVCGCAPGKCSCSSCPKKDMEMKKVPGTDKTVCKCGGKDEICPCAEGQCACSSCPKAEKSMDLKKVPGTEKTVCKCGGKDEICACESGKCACSSCPKAEKSMDLKKVPGTEKTTCKCGGNEGICACEAGKCSCSSCPKSEKA